MKITVTHDDGSWQDITEGVKVAFDVAYGSMDWGSGFLSTEEMQAVADLAEACQFPSFAAVVESLASHRRMEEVRQRMEREAAERFREQERQRAAEAAAARMARAARLAEAQRRIKADYSTATPPCTRPPF